jgi:hypothetical protein
MLGQAAEAVAGNKEVQIFGTSKNVSLNMYCKLA